MFRWLLCDICILPFIDLPKMGAMMSLDDKNHYLLLILQSTSTVNSLIIIRIGHGMYVSCIQFKRSIRKVLVDQIRHSEPGIKLGQIKPALNCDQGFFSVTQRGIKRNSCNCINEEILFGNRDSSCFCETSFITHIGGLDLLFLSFRTPK